LNRRDRLLNVFILFTLFTVKHVIEFRMNGRPWRGALCPELVTVSILFSAVMYGAGEAVEWIKKNRDYL